MEGTNPYLYALSCISGKWKMTLLHHIHHHDVIRFTQTKKTIPVSEKVLSQQLKELVDDGLIERIQYNTIPLKVEYVLTPVGKAIIPALDIIFVWSISRMTELGIDIDPDAFVVHTEQKYKTGVKELMDHYDEFCDIISSEDGQVNTLENIFDAFKEHQIELERQTKEKLPDK